MRKIVVLLAALFLSRSLVFPQGTPATRQPVPGPELRVLGAVQSPLTLTADDLKRMPRKTLTVTNPHSQKKESYEGVALEEILRKAGAPNGQQMRGPAMATYVLAEASDNYRVVFSLAELDSGIVESEIIVADTLDGAPLSEKEGPFKIVAPHEKRPARWVRMVTTITVISVPAK
jgi:DMSO/TMAO reductase YedYZ molybdopterin-dependent catalytic subunit